MYLRWSRRPRWLEWLRQLLMSTAQVWLQAQVVCLTISFVSFFPYWKKIILLSPFLFFLYLYLLTASDMYYFCIYTHLEYIPFKCSGPSLLQVRSTWTHLRNYRQPITFIVVVLFFSSILCVKIIYFWPQVHRTNTYGLFQVNSWVLLRINTFRSYDVQVPTPTNTMDIRYKI